MAGSRSVATLSLRQILLYFISPNHRIKTLKAEQKIVAQRMSSSTSYHILHSVFDVH